MNIMEKAAALSKERTVFAMVTVVAAKGSTPRSTASKMIVLEDGRIFDTIGGGIMEAKAIEAAVEAIKEGRPKMLCYKLQKGAPEGLPMYCGGDMDLFIDVIKPVPHVVIIGGGHVGYALSRTLTLLGWEYSVIEERAEYSSPARFPEAKGVHNEGNHISIPKICCDSDTFIVIVSKDSEKEVLKLVLPLNAPYIGMIGSKRKAEALFKELVEEGVAEAQLRGIHVPIGLDIGAETPEEIALSIAAEMVRIRKEHVSNIYINPDKDFTSL